MAKKTLASHQRYASSMMDWTDCLGLAYDPGTGKTATALDYLYRARARGEIENALILCPPKMISSWHQSVRKMLTFEGYTEAGVDDLESILTITSYQRTFKSETKKYIDRSGKQRTRRTIRLREELDHPWDVIIIDESHRIGAHDSAQTDATIKLGRLTSRRFVMSGTAVLGGGGHADYQKLYGQVKFLNDAEFKNWTEFKGRYVKSVNWFGSITAYREDRCRALLQKYFIVARRRDCFDLPPMAEHVIECPLAEPDVFEDIKNGRLAKYNLDITAAGGQYPKLLQICSGHLIRDDPEPLILKCSKDEAVEDILDSTDGKVIIFCRFRASIDRVAGILDKRKEDYRVFDGRSKTDTWRDVQEGDARVLVVQYQAGGEGLDLYAADLMIFFEPTLSSLQLEQAKARIMRKGQTKPCDYYYLVTPVEIESRTVDSVRRGVDVTAQMLDEWAKM